jgi:hypothetical protein
MAAFPGTSMTKTPRSPAEVNTGSGIVHPRIHSSRADIRSRSDRRSPPPRPRLLLIQSVESPGRLFRSWGDISPNANPVTAYRPYLADVRGGMVGDMGFTLDDFKTYIAGLRKPDWKKIFAAVIEDHHKMLVRLAKR